MIDLTKWNDAIENFKGIYPEEKTIAPVCLNETGTGLVIRVADGGYFTISDTVISRYFTNINYAKRYDTSW